MTTPNGQTPAGAANAESFAGWAQTTQDEAKSDMLGQFQQPYSGIGGWFEQFKNSPLAKIPILGDIIGLLGGRVTAAEKVAAQAGSVANATANVAVTTGFSDGQYFIRQTYVANGKWTPPAIPPGAVRTGYGIQCIGGGEGGAKPQRLGDGGPGGRHGGLVFRQVTVAQMGTGERDVTIGAGGVGATSAGFGQLGGISKFSNLLSSTPGGTSIQTVQGIMGSAARPGNGGRGGGVRMVNTDSNGSPVFTGSFGFDGESTSGATGGRGGTPAEGGWFGAPGQAPQTGGDATADDNLAAGGAGGGGGAGEVTSDAQAGAPGGDPGGGGGGGGAAAGVRPFIGTQWQPGNGGQGRNGRVDVWTYYTMENAA